MRQADHQLRLGFEISETCPPRFSGDFLQTIYRELGTNRHLINGVGEDSSKIAEGLGLLQGLFAQFKVSIPGSQLIILGSQKTFCYNHSSR